MGLKKGFFSQPFHAFMGQNGPELIKVLNNVYVSRDSSRVPVLLDLTAAFKTQPEH